MSKVRLLTASIAAAAILLQLFQPAQAATLTVDSTADGGDSDISDGVCNDGTGACTLRGAIEQANASSQDGFPSRRFGAATTGRRSAGLTSFLRARP